MGYQCASAQHGDSQWIVEDGGARRSALMHCSSWEARGLAGAESRLALTPGLELRDARSNVMCAMCGLLRGRRDLLLRLNPTSL